MSRKSRLTFVLNKFLFPTKPQKTKHQKRGVRINFFRGARESHLDIHLSFIIFNNYYFCYLLLFNLRGVQKEKGDEKGKEKGLLPSNQEGQRESLQGYKAQNSLIVVQDQALVVGNIVVVVVVVDVVVVEDFDNQNNVGHHGRGNQQEKNREKRCKENSEEVEKERGEAYLIAGDREQAPQKKG